LRTNWNFLAYSRRGGNGQKKGRPNRASLEYIFEHLACGFSSYPASDSSTDAILFDRVDITKDFGELV
jgi:hypothetical protein